MKKINKQWGIIGFYLSFILIGTAMQYSWTMNGWNLLLVLFPAFLGTFIITTGK
ncbi:MAG: hypothetical protein WC495_05845 [Patescibacteria group bacterium]|jgi:hypothetical protein